METNIHTQQHTKNTGVFNVLRKQIQMNGCDTEYISFLLCISDTFYRYEASIYNWDRTDHITGCNFTSNETEAVTSLQDSCGLLAKRRDRTEENGREYYVIECV